MTVKPRHDFKPCVPGAFHGGLARTEFFDGMVLSEAVESLDSSSVSLLMVLWQLTDKALFFEASPSLVRRLSASCDNPDCELCKEVLKESKLRNRPSQFLLEVALA